MPANNSVKRTLAAIEKDPSKVLGLTVGNQSISTGQYIPRADAQSPPELIFSTPSSTGSYMVVSLDIDAPFQSFNVLGPILHWIQPGLKQTPGTSTLTTSEPFVANYIAPAPPPGAAPHRYLFFLYEQPADFDGKKYAPPNNKNLSNFSRMRYDLDAWEKEAKLGQPVALNFFTSN